jgi:hypothetical protein
MAGCMSCLSWIAVIILLTRYREHLWGLTRVMNTTIARVVSRLDGSPISTSCFKSR